MIDKIPLDSNGCKNWPLGINSKGYGVYSICNITYSSHRLIYNTLKSGFSGDGMVIRHKCDNRACCNIDHLQIGTQSDNLMDASKRKRLKFGEENKRSIFNEEQIIEIRNSYPEKSTIELAKIYKTNSQTIRALIIGKTWNHIPGAKDLMIYNRALGEKMGRSKLTDSQVLEIRDKYPKMKGPELAKEYGVGHAMIYNIIKRKNWTHI